MPHKIIYPSTGADLRRFLTNTYVREWDLVKPTGYFHVSGFVGGREYDSGRYFANSSEDPSLSYYHVDIFGHHPFGHPNLRGDLHAIGFVIEAPQGEVLQHKGKNFWGSIARITVGWGVKAVEAKKFVVLKPVFIFEFKDLEAAGRGSLGQRTIEAFQTGEFEALFDRNEDDSEQFSGPGNDVMYGFLGTDVFVFLDKNVGKDKVHKFNADDQHDDHDFIRFSTDVFENWDALKDKIYKRGTSTVIAVVDDQEIELLHIRIEHIGEADFQFVPPPVSVPDEPMNGATRPTRAAHDDYWGYDIGADSHTLNTPHHDGIVLLAN